VAYGFEAGEASVSISSSEADSAGILKGLGEFGFGAKGVDGGVEFAKLILALTETGDIGCKSPVTQVVGGLSQVSVRGCTPLEETKEPRAHRLRGE